ncbi:MAG: MFS transporter [Candidatus Lokiarchaeota archaeon]|nr:MFS transporter [Candidatus Lokiarchaeota archaeon]
MEELPTKKSFRQYLYFMTGQQFSLLGSGIIGFVITWWITIETQSVLYLSLATFLIFLPQVIVTPFAGVLSDRLNRKTIIFTVDSLQAVLTFGLFLIFLTGFKPIWMILIIHTMRSTLFAFQVPTFHAILPSMVPKDKISRVNGVNFLFSGLIFMVGPILSALLLALFPITYIFLIDVVTFLIAVVPLFLIKIPFNAKENRAFEKKSFMREFKDGFKIVKAIPGLLSMIIFAMIFNFIFRPFGVLWPYFINIIHDGSAFHLAFLFGSIQVGNVIGSLITSIKKEWKNKIKINLVGEMVFFSFYLLIVIAPYQNFYLMMIGGFLGAIIFPITVSTYLTILQTVVPSDKIGRVMSIDHTISMAIAPIGALLVGPLAGTMGVVNLLLASALMGIVNPIILWFFTKIRYLDHPLEPEIEVEPSPAQEVIELETQEI